MGDSGTREADRPRPAVSVIVPFSGSAAAARAALRSLLDLELGPEDELLFVDNSERVALTEADGHATVIRAAEERSSYYARNVGAERARNSWLLFMDADCRAVSGVLDRYFHPSPDARTGILAGELLGESSQGSLAARWSRSRRGSRTSKEESLGPHPAGATGNMLVRREAWEEVGGFHEGIRSSADVELCWRAQDLGWRLEHRPDALATHADPERVRELMLQASAYGAGRRWLGRRYPGADPARAVASMGRSVLGFAAWTLAGRFEQARFKLLDLLWAGCFWTGYLTRSNRARREEPLQPAPQGPATVAIALDAPLDEPQIAALKTLRERAPSLRLEAAARPRRNDPVLGRQVPAWMLEDDAPIERLRDLLWLLVRHPLRRAPLRRGTRSTGASLYEAAPAIRRVLERTDARVVALGAHELTGAARTFLRPG